MSIESLPSEARRPRSAGRAPAWPDLGRADVGLLLTSRWRVTSPTEPYAAAERAAVAWSQSSAPAGLLASNVFISADARALLRISQWRDDREDGAPVSPPASQSRARAIVPVSEPAVEHIGTRIYRPYRSGMFRKPEEEPGVLFVIDLDLGGPGRAQDWIELIFEAIAADGQPPAGLMAGHFYMSDDGRRAVNLAEWVSAEAHAEAVATSAGFMGGGPGWSKVRAFAEGHVKSEHYNFLRSTVG
jgi:hypothetical protein